MEQKANRAAADGKQSAVDAAADPAQAATELKQWFERVKQSGEPTLSAADKDALVNIVAARTGKSRDEASQIVDNYAQAYQQAVQKVENSRPRPSRKRVKRLMKRPSNSLAPRGLTADTAAGRCVERRRGANCRVNPPYRHGELIWAKTCRASR